MAGHWNKNLTKRMAMGMKIVVNKGEIQRVKVGQPCIANQADSVVND